MRAPRPGAQRRGTPTSAVPPVWCRPCRVGGTSRRRWRAFCARRRRPRSPHRSRCPHTPAISHRGPRHHRRPEHGRAGGAGRRHRLLLRAALRLAVRLRGAAGRGPRRRLSHRPAAGRRPPQAAVPSRHQRPPHPHPLARRRGGDQRLHARGRDGGRAAAGAARKGGARRRALSACAAPRASDTAPCTTARWRTTARASRSSRTTRSAAGLAFLRLRGSVPLRVADGDAVAEFTLKHEQTATFILEASLRGARRPARHASATPRTPSSARSTSGGRGSAASTYRGRWRDEVNRSALVMRLLVSQEHGSLIAAPTFGLPESMGGVRNWDYRYTWVRDAAFTLYSLIRLGLTEETGRFIHWIAERVRRGGRRRAAAAAVRAGRRARRARAGAGAPGGVPRLAPRARGQRRRRAAADGHLRRADGLGVPVRQVRRAHERTTCGTR